ncbi:unnamed protein product [Rodentolepis nana]|uniref:Uncharacterized protein n=1 Tax=Rodentolepis nana TaxID=102285 RepID=A0A0R3TS66_RODNA|nr:unnamed protein product [Rodentolepis nana]
MVIFQNRYSAFVQQNQQQCHWIPANPQYVQGPVQFIYQPDPQQQFRPQPFEVPMGYPAFQGNPMSFQAFKPMPMAMQTQAMVQPQEMAYYNQYIIEQPQPQLVIPNVLPTPTVVHSTIPNFNATTQANHETLQDHSQLRQALQLNYNPYNKPAQPSSEPTSSVDTLSKFWERELSEEETKWAFEGINDLSYLGDPEFKRLVYSLSC